MIANVCALVIRNGKPLAVARKKKPGFSGLPGGKVDPGETPEQALLREFAEEVGVHLDPQSVEIVFDSVDETGTRTATYRATPIGAIPDEEFNGPENTAVFWATWEMLTSADTCEFPDYNLSVKNTA